MRISHILPVNQLARRGVFVFAVLLNSISGKCQSTNNQSQIDSLQEVLRNAGTDTTRVKTLNALSAKFYYSGSYKKSLDAAHDALTLSEKLGFKSGKALAYKFLGLSNIEETNYSDALINLDEFLKIAREINNKKFIADANLNTGLVHSIQGNYPVALDLLAKATTLYRVLGDSASIASCLNNQGNIYSTQGDMEAAIDCFQQALKINEETGDKVGTGKSLNNIAIIYKNEGNYPQSMKCFLASLKVKEEIGDKKSLASTLDNIGNLYSDMGNPVDGLKYYLEAKEIREEIGDKKGLSITLNNMAIIYEHQKDFDLALDHYRHALQIKTEIGDKKGIATALRNIGSVYEKQEKYSQSLENYVASLKIRKELNDKQGIASIYTKLGELNISTKKTREARTYLDSSLVLYKELGNKMYTKVCYLRLSVVDSMEGNPTAALANFKMASIYKDSLLNDESTSQVNEMKMLYDTEKKDNEIKLLSKDKEIQQMNLRRQTAELDKSHLLGEKQKQEIHVKNLTLEKSNLALQKNEQEKKLQKLQLVQAANEQKEITIKHEQELKQQQLIRNIIISAIAVLCIIAFLLFNRFQLRKKIESQQAIINERIRISRELHDDVGAQLSTAKLFLTDLKKNFSSENSKDLLDNSLGLLETSIKDLRVVMDDLRKSTLKDDGYIAAAEELVNTINQRHGIRFNMSHHGLTERLSRESEHNLFRITQELINNTLKYAEAKKVTIDLVKQPDKVVFTFEDDGKGFDQGKAVRGYGLSNIESRIKALDGHIEINSSPGNGFMAIIEIPLTT
ncbi:hypothetical protein BH11BAC1_BH11BAC1_15400 [soil metagenome]